jgi:Methyltransferase domain
VPFSPSSKSRLTEHDLGRFSGRTLFDRLGRAVCRAGCLPRKELFEAWETARRVRRLLRGRRIVDLGGGHGLLAQTLMLLDDASEAAVVVDRILPASHATLHEALVEAWPRLSGRVTFLTGEMTDVEVRSTDLVVSAHACGALTDRAIELASAARAAVAVLPCCHDLAACDAGGLTGWMNAPLAIDAVRAMRLVANGYRVWTRVIPAEITPKNRLLIAAPPASPR